MLLKPLIDLHGEPRNWTTAAALYIEALEDLPPELLAKAVSLAISGNPFFPKPAELRSSVAEEFGHHRKRLEAERLAALPKPVEPPPPTAEEVEEVDALVTQALQAIAGRAAVIQGGGDDVPG